MPNSSFRKAKGSPPSDCGAGADCASGAGAGAAGALLARRLVPLEQARIPLVEVALLHRLPSVLPPSLVRGQRLVEALAAPVSDHHLARPLLSQPLGVRV